MTLLQLEYFKVMSKVLHYSKAAEMLHTSQPNLGYAISELEKDLGVPLFEKKGRGVVLTKYGMYFALYVEVALDSLLKGRETLAQLDGMTDTISLAFIDEVGYDFLPELLHDFTIVNPNVKFNLYQYHNSVIVPKLLDGTINMAFSIDNHSTQLLTITPILKQEMVLFVPPNHRLAGRSSISLNEISIDPVVIMQQNTGVRRIIDDMCAEAHVQLNVLFETEECNAAAAYVSAGLAACILPRTPLHTKYRAIAIPISYPMRHRDICLLYNKSYPMSVAALKFRDFVLSRFSVFDNPQFTKELPDAPFLEGEL